jgi:pyrroline-5-carboxylate reductase
MPERPAPAAIKADTLILVGCGQMGSAMLRGWLAREAAAAFIGIEPAGLPAPFADTKSVAWHAAAEELPGDLTPDAVVFAVKPQIINQVLPAYRRWVRPQTLFLSIAAGIPIAGIARHLGEAAIIRTMPNTPAAIGRGITVACVRRCFPRSARVPGSRTRRSSIP